MAGYKSKCDRMTDNDLHVQLKPAIKVFLIKKLLTCTGQTFFTKGISTVGDTYNSISDHQRMYQISLFL